MPVERASETASTPEVTEPVPMSRVEASFSWRRQLLRAFAILFGAATLGWMIDQCVGDRHMLLMTLLTGVALAAGCWSAFVRWRNYVRPMKRLLEMLPDIRQGIRPIEELYTIDRGLAPLVPILQDLLRDVRLERARLAEHELEVRQRVSNRTDALERKIGSLQQQATRDALTGLHNRRLLDQELPALIEQSKLEYRDLTVLMIDVDYFKTLNDTLGHAAGDQLLKQIAQIIRSTINHHDAAFRCGGDEFVIVLPGSSIEIGTQLADRMRSLVDGLGKTLKVSRAPRLSIGLASLHKHNCYDAAALLALADKALYEVKSARPGPSRAA